VAVGVKEQARNEEILTNFKEKEGGISVHAKPLAMFLHELDDLGLSETKTIKVVTHSVEYLRKSAIFDHFMDRNLRFLRGRAFDVCIIYKRIDSARESFLRFRDSFLSVGFVKFKRLSAGNEFDNTSVTDFIIV